MYMRNRLNILLIDDDEEEYILLKNLIERSSDDVGQTCFQLDWVESYPEALEAYDKDEYDAYLVDYHLGEYTGLELMQEAALRGCKGPVILLTGQGSYQVDLAAMEAGASDYLVKDDLNLPLLERSIRYAIEQKQAQDRLEELVQERTAELVQANKELQAEIGRRKRVEVVLQESEAKFRTLADTTSAAIFIVQNFNIRYANPAVKVVTGFSPEELVGRNIWRIIHPKYRHVWKHYGLADEMGEGFPTRYELKILTKDNEERWVDVSAGSMEYEGQPAWVITAFDITERDLAERELRQAKEQLEVRVAERTDELRKANFQLSLTALKAERQTDELAAVFDAMTEAVTVFDEAGNLLKANRVAVEILGLELVGKNMDALETFSFLSIDGKSLTPDEYPIQRALRGETVRSCSLQTSNAIGRNIFVSVSSAPLYTGKRITGVVAVWQDITERHQLMEQLEEEQDNLQHKVRELDALHSAASALMNTLDIEVLLSEIVETARSAAPGAEKGMLHLKYPRNHYSGNGMGKDAALIPHEGDSGPSFFSIEKPLKNVHLIDNFQGSLAKVVCERKSLFISDVLEDEEIKLDKKIKELKGIRSLIAAPLQLGEECIGALSLGSSRVQAFQESDLRFLGSLAATASAAIYNASLYAEVQRLSMTDSLTELYNRRGLYVVGSREIERSRRFKRPLAAVLLDIDHFKPINDTHGHMIGDQVLVGLAKALQGMLRRVDILSRYGGEEFAILVPESDDNKAGELAERIRKAIEDTSFPTSVGDIRITISLGVAETGKCMLDLDGLLDCADHALYQAKNKGRNRVELGE
jgi:diguanylate cyclase (GGDEF)-like protein/PAS domain S-box-containing protein